MTPDAQTRAAMVDAACKTLAMSSDGAIWPDAYGEDEQAASREEIDAVLTAAILAAEARGFKLVGSEAMGKMLSDTRELLLHKHGMPIGNGVAKDIYKAMIAAAPGWGDGT